jgi:hypothetical protein
MPKGSKCLGRHATRIAINRSVAAKISGHVSGTVKHSQHECAVVERLEDDQVISMCANPYRVAQVWTPHVVMRSVAIFSQCCRISRMNKTARPGLSSAM